MVWNNIFHQRINTLWENAKDANYRLTLEAYAKRLGTTRSSLRGWLAGKGQPDADGFVRVAVREDVSLAWLLGDPRGYENCSRDETDLLQKFRNLTRVHQEDILAFVNRYYEQDRVPPSSNVKNKQPLNPELPGKKAAE